MHLLTKLRWNAFLLWHTRKERSLPYLPLTKIEAIQSRRVRAMIQHAYRNVPFYREAMVELGLKPRDFQNAADLAKLPVINARLYVDQTERFLARNFGHADGLTLHSSGTSGLPKNIRYDARALFLSLANGYRHRTVFAHYTGHLLGYRESHFSRPSTVSKFIRGFYEERSWMPRGVDLTRQALSPGDRSLEETVEDINQFRPDVLSGYGSYLGVLFREIHRRKLPLHRPKLISYGADLMPDADRLLIEQEFGVTVTSTYQSVEALRIGFFCEQRTGFHLSLDTVAVRVVDDDNRDVAPGETGHVIISNLTNRATVLLNYKLGDVVTRIDLPCPCGRTLPMIGTIRGRSDDVLRLADGRVMHGLVATEAMLAVPNVRQFQVIQQTCDRFVLRAVGQPGADHALAATELANALRSKVGSTASVEVEWLDAIPPGPNGKVKSVISEVV